MTSSTIPGSFSGASDRSSAGPRRSPLSGGGEAASCCWAPVSSGLLGILAGGFVDASSGGASASSGAAVSSCGAPSLPGGGVRRRVLASAAIALGGRGRRPVAGIGPSARRLKAGRARDAGQRALVPVAADEPVLAIGDEVARPPRPRRAAPTSCTRTDYQKEPTRPPSGASSPPCPFRLTTSI